MFITICGMLVNLKDYIENKNLLERLQKDESFGNDVKFYFEREYLNRESKISNDKLLELIIKDEIAKRFKN